MQVSRERYIYSLADPITNDIRYIGQTIQNPRLRLSSHISTSKHNRKKDYCHCWIKSLLNKGLKPKLDIIETTDDIEREKYWIAHYIDNNYKLTNHKEGGQSTFILPKNKLKRRVTISNRINNSKLDQYDIFGKFLRTWDTRIEFAKIYNTSISNVSNAIKRNTVIANSVLVNHKEPFRLTRKFIMNIPIYVYDINHFFIKKYDNKNQASKDLHISTTAINRSIKNSCIVCNKYYIKVNR